MHRPGGAEAGAGIVDADDEKAIGVERLAGADDDNLQLEVKKEYKDEEDAIIIDIQRAIQVI